MEQAARLVILIALVLLMAALADLLLRDRSIDTLGDPRWSGDQVEALLVDLPPIRKFDYYYGGEEDDWRNLNPFVPYSERRAERERLENTAPRSQPEEHNFPIAVDPRVNEVEIEIPDLALPALSDTQKIQVPEVLGRMGMRGQTYVLVKYDGKIWQISPGDKLDVWTLSGIAKGEAIFLDDHGEEWRVRIGKSDEPTINHFGDQGGGSSAAASGGDTGGDLSAAVAELKKQLGAALKKRDIPAMQQLLSKADPAVRQELQRDPEVRELMKSPFVQQMLQQR